MKSGIYLIIDPAMSAEKLLANLEAALQAEVAAVQVWDNWQGVENKASLLLRICSLCAKYQVMLLANNEWELMKEYPIDGVHFDEIPEQFDSIKKEMGLDKIIGITCNNELETVIWAEKNDLDYLSFCSMFPSQTANSCELVSHETVKKAREITKMPIYLAGGIRPENVEELAPLAYDGLAIVSGIMSQNEPKKAVELYVKLLNKK